MQIVTLHTKHGDRVFAHQDGWELKIVQERLGEGWFIDWDDGDPKNQWEERAKQIVETQDVAAAETFMYERQDHEYESYSVEELERL